MNSQFQQQQYQIINNPQIPGKIFKGTLNQAPLKIKVASIPTKQQNIISHVSASPAFGNSQQRFINSADIMPGPGRYEVNKSSGKIDSKKGWGHFASSSKFQRTERVRIGNPGPGTYKDIKTMRKQKIKSFNIAISKQIKSHKLFDEQIGISKQIPGPGQYSKTFSTLKSRSCTNIPFKSKVLRFQNKINEIPPLGSYEPQNNKRNTIKTHYFAREQYKSDRNLWTESKYIEMLKKNVIDSKKVGPCTYNTNIKMNKSGFTIKQGIRDRFGNLKILDDISRMVQTQKKYTQQEQKQLQKINKGATSMFKSKVQRHDFETKFMDPGIYSPQKLRKMSHLINYNRKWV